VFVSAELRWFWPGSLPGGVEAWFEGGPVPPGGGQSRVDEYLVDPGQTEVGLKKRGASAGVEIKGLVGHGRDTPAPFAGRVEIWSKWNSRRLAIDGLPRVRVRKRRLVRKFDTAAGTVSEVALDADERVTGDPDRRLDRGCQLELVAIALGGEADNWWSIGLEAFGELSTVADSLDATLSHLSAGAPALTGGLGLSYPAWLSKVADGLS